MAMKIQMATAPTETLQVANNPLAPNTRPVDFSFSKTFAAIQNVANEIQVTQANTAFNNLQKDTNNIIYGKNGYASAHGQDAVDRFSTTTKELKAVADSHAKDLSPFSRRMYDKQRKSLLTASAAGMLKHQATESRIAKLASLSSTVDNSVQFAGTTYMDDKRIDTNYIRGVMAIDEQAKSSGVDQEAHLEMVKVYNNQFWSSAIIGAIADNNLGKAKELFDENSDDMDSRTRLSLSNTLNADTESNSKASILMAAQTFTDNNYKNGLTPNQNFEVLKTIKDPEERKSATQMFRQRAADDKKSKAINDINTTSYLLNKRTEGERFTESDNLLLSRLPFEAQNNIKKGVITGVDNDILMRQLKLLSPEDFEHFDVQAHIDKNNMDINGIGLMKVGEYRDEVSKGQITVRQKARESFNKIVKPTVVAFVNADDSINGGLSGLPKSDSIGRSMMETTVKIIGGFLVDKLITRKETNGEPTILTDDELQSIARQSMLFDEEMTLASMNPALATKLIADIKASGQYDEALTDAENIWVIWQEYLKGAEK